MSFNVERWTRDESPNAVELRAKLENDGYSVFQWSDSPGTYYSPHQHPEDQSHWIIAGELELTVEGQSYTLQAGDRDFLPAGTVHEAVVPGASPVVYLIGAKR